jgi:putative oxidoreductase
MDKFNKLLAANEPFALGIFRFMIGLAMFQFGVAKVLKFPVVAPFDKVAVFSLFWAAGIIELVFGGLLMLGLFTRCVAVVLCGEMAFAYFIEHFPKGFIPLLNGGNLAIMFCFACLLIATAGGGPWSLDALLRKKR